jgi:hypothetical protein
VTVVELRELLRDLTGVRLDSVMDDTQARELLSRAHLLICSSAEWEFLTSEEYESVYPGEYGAEIYLTNITRIRQVVLNDGTFLQHRTQEEISRLPAHRRTPRKPYAWFNIYEHAIQLFPEPDVEYESVAIWGWTKAFEWTVDTNTPKWSDRTLDPVVAYEAAAQLLEREGDDPDRVNWMRKQAQAYIDAMARTYLPAGSAVSWPPGAVLAGAAGMPLSFNQPDGGGQQ